MRYLAVLFAVFILSLAATHIVAIVATRVCTAFLAIAGLAFQWLLLSRSYWFLMTFALMLNLPFHYETAANHYFLTVYVSGLFAVWVAPGGARLVKVGGMLIALVMVFAVVSKLLSPYYLKGNLVGEFFLPGTTLKGLLSLVWPEISLGGVGYFVNFEATKAIPPGVVVALPAFVPSTAFTSLCQATAVLIVVVEGLVAFAFAIRWKYQAGLLAIFLWGTFIFRPEYYFLALLALLGLTSTEPHLSKQVRVLRLSFYIFTLVGTLGYRPAFL